MPRVSIVTATYNAEDFVMRTISSALEQTYGDFEYLVVDDGSSDRTAELVEAVADPRVTVHRQQNAGASVARNRAIAAAKGEMVALLDHDDIWFPERLERLVGHLDANPGIGYASTDMYVGDPAQPESARRILDNPVCAGLEIPDPSAWARACGFSGSTALVRRELFERHGDYDLSLLYAPDWELMLRFWLGGETAAMLPEPMGWTVMRPGQLSDNTWGVFADRRTVLERALRVETAPPEFHAAVERELEAARSDGAELIFGAALDHAEAARAELKREAAWASRHHLHGRARLAAKATAIWPGGLLAVRRLARRLRGAAGAAAKSEPKPAEEFPADERHRSADPRG